MRIAHLILAHNKPEQLMRLVQRLAHPDADVYIHVDEKAGIEQFDAVKQMPQVYLVTERVKVYWGSFNIVQATINGFRQIIRSGRAYGYINLLSGQDYPLKPAADIHSFLTANPGHAFMNALVAHTHWLEALPRVEQYHLNNFNFPGKYMVQQMMNKVLPKRRMPEGMVLVGRSQWFTISGECVSYILDYWDNHPAFRKFMQFTWAPDEFLFQTILYNSPLKENMVDDDLRYIDWSGGGVSPKTFTMADAVALLQSGKLYARKFDLQIDSAVLDAIDNNLLK